MLRTPAMRASKPARASAWLGVLKRTKSFPSNTPFVCLVPLTINHLELILSFSIEGVFNLLQTVQELSAEKRTAHISLSVLKREG